MKKRLLIIKIGGNIIDDEKKFFSFLQDFASLSEKKILVHGGGKLATRLAAQLNIPQQVVEGRRITDVDTLKIVTMVYAGYINKTIVAKLQSFDCNAIGLSGADGNSILAHKRAHPSIDYGFVGDVDAINSGLVTTLLQQGLSPVFAPVTHDKQGQLLNTNADTIAKELATALSPLFEVTLIYSFEKEGVLSDPSKDDSVIPVLDPAVYKKYREEGKINEGMIPKLDNAFSALNSGVNKVIIGNAEKLKDLVSGKKGTSIVNV